MAEDETEAEREFREFKAYQARSLKAPAPAANGAKHPDWGKIITGVVGALILGLQGVNLSEVAGVSAGGEKRQVLLEQLIVISKDIEKSLDNQTKMLEHDNKNFENQQHLFENQQQILDTLTTAIKERRDLLRQNLEDSRKQANPSPSPSPSPN
jgi:hypothetical protein